jgi:DNA-binding NtrC family response regulator
MALHILVVDDDADVLTILVEMLRVSGFIVTAADAGIAMREILADKALLPINAVVLDSAMPGEPSARLALHAKNLRLPVVMISGSPEAMKFAEENHFQLLPKPFRMAELVDAIGAAVMSGEFGQRDA